MRQKASNDMPNVPNINHRAIFEKAAGHEMAEPKHVIELQPMKRQIDIRLWPANNFRSFQPKPVARQLYVAPRLDNDDIYF